MSIEKEEMQAMIQAAVSTAMADERQERRRDLEKTRKVAARTQRDLDDLWCEFNPLVDGIYIDVLPDLWDRIEALEGSVDGGGAARDELRLHVAQALRLVNHLIGIAIRADLDRVALLRRVRDLELNARFQSERELDRLTTEHGGDRGAALAAYIGPTRDQVESKERAVASTRQQKRTTAARHLAAAIREHAGRLHPGARIELPGGMAEA